MLQKEIHRANGIQGNNFYFEYIVLQSQYFVTLPPFIEVISDLIVITNGLTDKAKYRAHFLQLRNKKPVQDLSSSSSLDLLADNGTPSIVGTDRGRLDRQIVRYIDRYIVRQIDIIDLQLNKKNILKMRGKSFKISVKLQKIM